MMMLSECSSRNDLYEPVIDANRTGILKYLLLTVSPLYFSLEEDFISWREQFWPAVCEHFGVEPLGDESR